MEVYYLIVGAALLFAVVKAYKRFVRSSGKQERHTGDMNLKSLKKE